MSRDQPAIGLTLLMTYRIADLARETFADPIAQTLGDIGQDNCPLINTGCRGGLAIPYGGSRSS